jgi:hypothetical protein
MVRVQGEVTFEAYGSPFLHAQWHVLGFVVFDVEFGVSRVEGDDGVSHFVVGVCEEVAGGSFEEAFEEVEEFHSGMVVV